MTVLPVTGYLSDNARTEGEQKTAFEDLRDVVAELPGGSSEGDLTIATGVIIPTKEAHKVDTQSGDATDDLDSITSTNTPSGRLLTLRAKDGTHTVVVKHNGAPGADDISLNDGADFSLDDLLKVIGLRFNGTYWEEVWRGPYGTMAVENIAAVPAMTYAAEQSYADQILDQPKIRDYGEVVNAIGAIGGGTQDIDLELGNIVTGTVDTSTTTFTFSNPPITGTAGSFTLILTNGGSQTDNWPASVDWAADIEPVLVAAGVDVLTFLTVDAGTIWYGFAAGLDMK